MARAQEDEMRKSFENAASFVRSSSSSLNPEVLLKLYALYKQATVGPCQPSSSFTSWFGINKMKQDAWQALGEMSKEEAMQKYIILVASQVENKEKESSGDEEDEEELTSEEESDNGGRGGKIGWVRVSRLLFPQESEIVRDEEKSLVDWAKEGDLEGLIKALKTATLDEINRVDSSGMAPLHWAADRGHTEAVQVLVDAGANTNSKDLECQTALHYAASCGHRKVVCILLKSGSDPEAPNSDGERPVDLASGEEIKELFTKHVNAIK